MVQTGPAALLVALPVASAFVCHPTTAPAGFCQGPAAARCWQHASKPQHGRRGVATLKAVIDPTTITSAFDPIWVNSVLTGIADAASTVADVAGNVASDTVAPATAAAADTGGVFGFLTELTGKAITGLADGLHSAGVPSAYGISIILFTLFVKGVTFPLTYKQLSSTTKMQALQPQVKDIQKRLSNNPEAANKAIADLYQREEVNPLSGCLPSLAQVPIFISLYRALLNLAKENKLSEGFLWLPSLEGPVFDSPPTESMKWILPNMWDGFNPPLGWADTLAYLSVPIILVVTQSYAQKLMQPPPAPDAKGNDPNQQSQAILKFLPLMIGWFSLNVPSGLGLYWIVNNFVSTAVSVLIRSQLSEAKTAPAAGGASGGGGGSDKGFGQFVKEAAKDVGSGASKGASQFVQDAEVVASRAVGGEAGSSKDDGESSDDEDGEINGEILNADGTPKTTFKKREASKSQQKKQSRKKSRK